MKSLLKIVSLILALGVCLAGPLQAQKRYVGFVHLPLIQGDTAQPIVHTILQDQTGFLWLGTNEGLYKYDGYDFTVFRHDPEDPASLSADTVTTLHEDRSGVLWIGTSGSGLNRLDPITEQFRRYPHDPDDLRGSDHNAVQAIEEDQTGTLWVGTEAGLDRFDARTGRFTHYPLDALDLTDRHAVSVHALFGDRDGRLWVGTSDGVLCRFDEETLAFTCHRLGGSRSRAEDRTIAAIHEDHAGTLWIGTGAGLYRFERETGTFTPSPLADPDNPESDESHAVTAIYETQDGALWIGTARHGLVRLDPSTGAQRHFRHDPENPHSLRNDKVLALYEDRSGLLWASTDAGLQKVFRTPFAVYDIEPLYPDDLSRTTGNTFFEDRSGRLWVGSNSGLFRYDRERKKPDAHYWGDPDDRDNPRLLNHDYVHSIEEDHEGMLWISTLTGLNRFDPRTETFKQYKTGYYDARSLLGFIYDMRVDRTGDLWIAAGQSFHRFEPETDDFTRFRFRDARKDGTTSIFEDQDGVLWIGTLYGLARFDPSILDKYDIPQTDPSSLPSSSSIYKDRWGQIFNWAIFYPPDSTFLLPMPPNGVAWLRGNKAGQIWGFYGYTIFKFDPRRKDFDHFLTFSERHNQPACLLVDETGTPWFTTPANGLWKIDATRRALYAYKKDGGLPTDEFIHRACYRNERGEMYFGTRRGFIVFYPDSLRPNPPPSVVLTDFSVQGKPADLRQPITATRQIRLGYNQDSFTFTFAALDYAAPEQNHYAYLLEGYDEDWIEADTRRTASYINVSYGRYVFRVRGANRDGVWSEEEATVDVLIVLPFWERWWFYPLAALFGLSLVGMVVYAERVRRLKVRERDLQQMVDERTRELRLEKQKTEVQAEALREQADKLMELDRLKARFYANVSHEFRTPLTLILGPLNDLLDENHGSLNDAQRDQLGMMRRSSTRLHRLIGQLLDISKLEAGSMRLHARRHDLVAFIKNIMEALTPLAERRRLALDLHTELETLAVYFDAEKLEKVVNNLLSNALKFTPEEGRVRVVVQEVVDEVGTFAEIRVRDTGPGIPADELPHIFDRFYQVDGSTTRAHEGTGIGLSLAKELVDLHRGTIDVESEVDFGTTFIVRLPLGDAHLAPEGLTEPDSDEETAGGGLRLDLLPIVADEPVLKEDDAALPDDAPIILIVEDNADVRGYLKRHLAPYYHVAEAADGEAGLATAREIKPALVVSDVMMPRMDGYDLCRALKADDALSDIPVILLTAKADEQSEIEGLETGADDYIAKPFSAEVLLARVENLIEIRRQLRERFGETFWVRPGAIEITSADAAFLDQVRAVVETNLGNHQFSVTWLADEVALSRRQLDRRLRSLTRLTASGFIRKMRLERAVQLLEQQAGNISEVAYAVGFRDVQHFSKLFHQTFGVSPSDYAKNCV